MKKLTTVILILFSILSNAQSWNPLNGRTRFPDGFGLPVLDSNNFKRSKDTAILYFGRDSSLWYRYKGWHKKVSPGGGAVTSVNGNTGAVTVDLQSASNAGTGDISRIDNTRFTLLSDNGSGSSSAQLSIQNPQGGAPYGGSSLVVYDNVNYGSITPYSEVGVDASGGRMLFTNYGNASIRKIGMFINGADSTILFTNTDGDTLYLPLHDLNVKDTAATQAWVRANSGGGGSSQWSTSGVNVYREGGVTIGTDTSNVQGGYTIYGRPYPFYAINGSQGLYFGLGTHHSWRVGLYDIDDNELVSFNRTSGTVSLGDSAMTIDYLTKDVSFLNPLTDANIASAATWNAKQDAISYARTPNRYYTSYGTWGVITDTIRGNIGLTTTGTNGTATYNPSTGVFNIPKTDTGRANTQVATGWDLNKVKDSITNIGYLTGNQTITLSGDVSGSGTTAITTAIGSGKVTNTMLAGSIDTTKTDAVSNITAGSGVTIVTQGKTKVISASGGTGTVTSVGTRSPLQGGDITGAGTITLNKTGIDSLGTVTVGTWQATALDTAYTNGASRVTASGLMTTVANGKTYGVSMNYDPLTALYRGLGATIKAQPPFGMDRLTTSLALTDGQIRWVAIYIPTAQTLTGCQWYQSVQGSYTADNTNSVGLYSYDGAGTLTKVAESTNDNTIWSTSSNNTLGYKAFSSTYNAAPGVYYIAFIYNNSAATTNPSLAAAAATGNASNQSAIFANSAKLGGTSTGSSLPSTQATSGISAQTTNVWIAVY